MISNSPGGETDTDREVGAVRAFHDLERILERERGYARRSAEEVRAGLEYLGGVVAGREAGTREGDPELRRFEGRLQRLAEERKRNREVIGSRLDQIGGEMRELASASELAALRDRVIELRKAAHRARAPSRSGARAALRRGGPLGILLAPVALVVAPIARLRRGRTTPPAGSAPAGRGVAASPKRPSRLRRRIGRLPRRAKLRTRRALRRPRYWIRSKLFSRGLGNLNHHPPKELRIPRRYRRPIELTNPPVISVVTPTFNTGPFLERTMLSVLDQDYPRLEYVVQDGGSTDETEGVLERHSERLHHAEMRPDDGHAHAINLGFAHTTGNVMAFLNADDILLPGSLNYVAHYFERHPEVDLVYGHRVLVDEKDMEIGRWVLPRHDDEVLGWADFIPQETMFWRRRLWERAGGRMDQDWPFSLDWELLLRFVDANARSVRLPRFLGGFRIHEAQKTSAIMDTQGGVEMAGLRKRVHGREVTREEIRAGVKPYMRRHVFLHRLYRLHLVRY